VGSPPIVSIYVGLDERAGHPDGIAGGKINFSVSEGACYVGVVVYARGSKMCSLLPLRKPVAVFPVHGHVLLVFGRMFLYMSLLPSYSSRGDGCAVLDQR
jgi:hypothetical protein